MINFLKYKWLYFSISIIVILFGLYSIFTFGYKFSIDFVGGSVVEYQSSKEVKKDQVIKLLAKNEINFFSIEKNNSNYVLRVSAIDGVQEELLRNEIKKNNPDIRLLRFETVGPSLGKETMNKTLVASLMAIGGIMLYMTFAFSKFNYGLSAILAMLHDFLVVVGVYSIMSKYFGAEIDSLFVTGVLTTMSFSVHDTIVVFDKIREYKKTESSDFSYLANKALTETMVRSLNNSLTIILMLLALVLLGGSTIKFFAITLLVGTITGTYSSPFIATPILDFLEKNKK